MGVSLIADSTPETLSNLIVREIGFMYDAAGKFSKLGAGISDLHGCNILER